MPEINTNTASASVAPGATPSAAALSPSHLAFVDALRGLAAIYVVIHHCIYSLFDVSQPVGGVLGFFVKAFANGHTAVVAFIVISGFCLGLPVAKRGGVMAESTGRFFLRRAARILPPYWAALALGAILGSTIVSSPIGTGREWDTSLPISLKAIGIHTLLLGDVFAAYTEKVNHPLWSVAVETKIYLCLPVMVWALHKFGLWRTLLGVALAAVGLWGSLTLWHDHGAAWLNLGSSGISPHFLMAFFFGVILAQQTSLSASGRIVKARFLVLLWSVVALVLGLAALALPASAEEAGRFMLRDLSKAALMCLLMLGLLRINQRAGVIDRWWATRAASVLGLCSYSLYLTHAPIIEWVMRKLGAYQADLAWRLEISVVIAPAIAVAFAVAFFWLIERPAHRWARRLAV